MTAKLPDPERVRRGTVVVEWEGARWQVCCAEHAEPPYKTHPDDSDHPDGVLVIRQSGDRAAILRTLEPGDDDLLLAGTPMRKPNGEPIPTGEATPGYQPDCEGCMTAAEMTVDHMASWQHNRATAMRQHRREIRRLTAEGLL